MEFCHSEKLDGIAGTKLRHSIAEGEITGARAKVEDDRLYHVIT